MLSVSDHSSVVSVASSDRLEVTGNDSFELDIELAQMPQRRPSLQASELRESSSSVDSSLAQIETSITNPQENAETQTEHQAPQMALGMALRKAISDVLSPKAVAFNLLCGFLGGEAISSVVKAMDVGCDDEHVAYESNTGERLCTLNADVMKEVLEEPSTHLWALAGLGGAGILTMALAVPRIVNKTRAYLNPEPPSQQGIDVLQHNKQWSDGHEVKTLTLEQAQKMKQEILEQCTEGSENSLFHFDTIDELLAGQDAIVFIKQDNKYQFCKEKNLSDWFDKKSGQLINPMYNLEYDNPEISIYRPTQSEC